MRSPRSASYAGATMALLGFLLMGAAWGRAAEAGFSSAALPAAITGGLAGLGLVVGGMAVTVVVAQRVATARRAREMGRVQQELDTLIRLVVQPGPEEGIDDVTTVDVAAGTVHRRIERKALAAAAPTGASPQARSTPPAGTSSRVPRVPAQPAPAEPAAPAGENPWAPPRAGAQVPAADEGAQALLDQVDELGPVEQTAVLERFPSAAALRAASFEELQQVPGLSEAQVQRLHDALR